MIIYAMLQFLYSLVRAQMAASNATLAAEAQEDAARAMMAEQMRIFESLRMAR